jgi:hypothetical protein
MSWVTDEAAWELHLAGGLLQPALPGKSIASCLALAGRGIAGTWEGRLPGDPRPGRFLRLDSDTPAPSLSGVRRAPPPGGSSLFLGMFRRAARGDEETAPSSLQDAT